ncbi:hypothetical protein [Cupriavidus sp. WS]|uniref:hypothetical protein n=1 Tax=Cupriavidus sp. WS TaxID=1312922 RepID=UPI00039D3401|nr:hypothetical protein [Cupriavidus sp. WS]
MIYEYSRTPALAKVYPDFRQARKTAIGIQKHRALVAYLFDHGSQWAIGFTEDEPDGNR